MAQHSTSNKDKKPFKSYSPKKRLLTIFLSVVFLFVAVLVKFGFTMLYDGKDLQIKAQSEWLRSVPTDAPRGNILDRNGVALASTATRYNVYVRPNSVEDKDALITALIEVFGFDEEEIRTKLARSQSEIIIAKSVSKEQLNTLYSKNISGVYYAEDNFRYYPYGDFMTQVLGFTGADGNGQTGIEAYYDKYLTGINGRIMTETDLVGREIKSGDTYYQSGISGLDVVTTLDANVQRIVEGAIDDAVLKYNPKGVYCVAMNYENGEILALAEYPSFDLNNVPRDDLQTLFANSKSFLVSSVYEPGSTFKILTAAAALDSGKMSTSHRFYCAGSRIVDGKKIRCWKSKGHGSIDFAQGVEQSCNCVFMDSALSLGTDLFYSYLSKFGLKSKTGIDMTGETSGIFISQSAVKPVDLARIGFGQAVAVTPIGMIAATSAVVNGGNKITPHILKEVRDKNGKNTINSSFEISSDKVISSSTSLIMRDLLERVVSNGSGKGAAVNGYSVAGKTGTAQKYENGKIAQGKYISSFMGFSLEKDAPIAVLMIVDEPKGSVYYGSLVAAPLVGKIYKSLFDYYAIAPAKNYKDIESTFNPDDEIYIDFIE